jgi:hypothetical protein
MRKNGGDPCGFIAFPELTVVAIAFAYDQPHHPLHIAPDENNGFFVKEGSNRQVCDWG